MINLRRLNPGEGWLFRQVRLAALLDSPHAFSTTYASALERSSASWNEQADRSAKGGERATFVAFSDEQPVAMAAVYGLEDEPAVAELLQVWVTPELRGSGVAASLLDTALGWARANGFRRIAAGVMHGNDRALAFYLKYGFKLLPGAGDNATELRIVKDLDAV